jgi:hypothetical protein
MARISDSGASRKVRSAQPRSRPARRADPPWVTATAGQGRRSTGRLAVRVCFAEAAESAAVRPRRPASRRERSQAWSLPTSRCQGRRSLAPAPRSHTTSSWEAGMSACCYFVTVGPRPELLIVPSRTDGRECSVLGRRRPARLSVIRRLAPSGVAPDRLHHATRAQQRRLSNVQQSENYV